MFIARTSALDALSALTVEDAPHDVFSTPPQLDGDLITLTLLPRSRWQTLLNLEVIQVCVLFILLRVLLTLIYSNATNRKSRRRLQNKPPSFFQHCLELSLGSFLNQNKKSQTRTSRPSDWNRLQPHLRVYSSTNYLQRMLEETVRDSSCHILLYKLNVLPVDETFFSFAKMLSPAAIDLELRSLVTLDSLQLFIHALTRRLLSHRDFEAVQTLQNVFLRMHADVIIANPELQDNLDILMEVQKRESERVLELIASSLGTLGFVRDTL